VKSVKEEACGPTFRQFDAPGPNQLGSLRGFDQGPDLDISRAQTDHHPVSHPRHYTSHPSGVECIQITEHMGFCLGNAMKYLWRADLKGGTEDLQKARWYIDREIARRGKPCG